MVNGQDGKTGRNLKHPSPIPISLISGRYLLFDIENVTYLRREHRICGVTIGTLPQSPSQNVFLGIPLEIMPEEAALLVEKRVAIIVDDARAHDQALRSAETEAVARRNEYMSRTQAHIRTVEEARIREKEKVRRQNMKKRSLSSQSSTPRDENRNFEQREKGEQKDENESIDIENVETETQNDSLFSSEENNTNTSTQTTMTTSCFATPTSSTSLLPSPSSASPSTKSPIPTTLPPSYPLYKHLHEKRVLHDPGLRFGCQYSVYPGDPLRYHSHFLAIGTEWDEEIDLMDIVGGGRLGTGVKKGYLFGGLDLDDNTDGVGVSEKVKTFSVEWAAM